MNNYEILSYESVAKGLNNRVYTNYYYRLMLIAKSLFKWENLPNGINEKWIERFLYSEGGCIFFKDPTLGYMITKFAKSGKLNWYDEPTKVRAYATDYISTEHENNVDCIIIRNNDDMIPTFPTIQLYAHDLTNIKRTIDTNIISMKMPNIILCSDKQKLSLKQVIKQKNDNEPVIYGDKNLDLNEIKVLNTLTPIVFDKLQIHKNNVTNAINKAALPTAAAIIAPTALTAGAASLVGSLGTANVGNAVNNIIKAKGIIESPESITSSISQISSGNIG